MRCHMSKKYRVLFIQATQYSATGSKKLCKKNRMYLPGLVFPLLAAYTPDHWDVQVKLEVVDDIDFNEDVDMVGIGCMGHAVFRGIDIADEFRKRGKTVFFGGYMPSMLPSFVAPHADSIVIGDAEISYPKLLKDFEKNGKLRPIYNNPLDSLAGLPVPKYEYIIEKNIGDMLPVQAGRGCPHSCSFCSVACIYKGKYLVRPIEEVMRDIDRIQELGYKGLYLLDDNIVGNPRYLEDFADRMMDRKMIWSSQCSLQLARNPRLLKKVAESGCKVLSFGLESITQEGLNRLNKKWVKVDEHEELLARIRDAGIMASTEMMIGTDSDTEESIRETAAFVRRAKVAIPRFYVLTPFPGSPLYDEYKKKGRLIHENYIEYTGTNCVHYPEKISPEKLNEMYRWITKEVFSLGHIFSRLVFNKYFLKNFKYYFIALLMNLQYRFMTRRGDAPNIF
jgi:radical SAM superfamily enzyme YgiQ (UPF0313 family)